MKNKQLILSCIVFFLCLFSIEAQNHKYYVRAISQSFNPDIYQGDISLKYKGSDESLKSFFENNEIYIFNRPFLNFSGPNLQRTFYIEANSSNLLTEIQNNLSYIFDFGEYVGNEGSEILCEYPNDYGQTGPPGTNQGLNVNLGYLDYIDMPTAWEYTTGDSNIKIGISDGGIVETDLEFVNKIQLLSNSISSVPHGTTVSAIAAAQGNNTYGITGVCQDCDIIRHGYGNISYIIDLYNAGARVINCSWASGYSAETVQELINEITQTGTIIVAASGNSNSTASNQGQYFYPASYDNVISVGAVGHINDLECSNIQTNPQGTNHIPNVKDYVGGSIGFFNNTYDCLDPLNPLENQVLIYPVSAAILNDKVDILGASGNSFKYGDYLVSNVILYSQYNGFHTSHTAPQVSGTVGLMKTLNDCLSFKEVESILKISSKYIGDIPANNAYDNEYGSGGLNAGRAVQLTNNLKDPDSTAYLQNQKFSRWDFIFNGISENIIIQNQEFTEGSTLILNSKNIITVEDGSLFEPNSEGFVLLEIDPNLIISCVNPFRQLTDDQDKEEKDSESLYQVYPTLVDSEINIVNTVSKEVNIKTIEVYDIFNQEVYKKFNITTPEILLDVSNLPQGIYILKGYNEFNENILTTKFIKK